MATNRVTLRRTLRLLTPALGFAAMVLFIAPPARAAADIFAPEVEGSFHGLPVLRDMQGKRLADGDFTQWIEQQRLYIRNAYDFGAGHGVEERVVCQVAPLVQEEWSWRELVADTVQREYFVDLKTGEAWARKRDGNEIKESRARLKIEPGRTFAGVGFTVALRHLRDRIVRGETIELRAVGFTPKPRLVTVRISHAGVDQMLMAGRRISGDRFVIQPQIPAVAKWLVHVPDTRIWLTHPWPAGFLRWEGPFAEPGDPVVRVDLLPGDPSGPAEPAPRSSND